MTEWFTEAAARLSETPWLQGVLAALATFVLEDPTTVGCGLLVADGRMTFVTALVGVSAGIAAGDVGLYAIGRSVGPRGARWSRIAPERLDRAAGWFRNNLVLAILVSRFVPGMRLPTYLAAGVLRASFGRFVAVAVGASLVWTFLLLQLTVAVGRGVLPLLGRARWPIAALAILALVLLQRRAARGFERELTVEQVSARPFSQFEFWPPWLFYAPVALYYLWLALRFRGLLLPTVANPSIQTGGLLGESKSAILDLVPAGYRRWVAAYTVYERPDRTIPLVRVTAAARAAIDEAGLAYPLVAKPDIGQRGAGVRPVRSDADLESYLRDFPPGGRLLLQTLVGGSSARGRAEPSRSLGRVREAGVLYWRAPGELRGRIFSITLKELPELIGDGRRMVRELIDADPRARRIRRVYFQRHADELDRVLDDGEAFPLVFAGNHCQGAIFRDGTGLATAELEDRIHSIASAMPEFYFGRFDILFDDVHRFFRGEDLTIVEINGAGAEATHIWDASMRLGQAYATLFEQFRILFAIGAANRRRGFRPQRATEFIRAALAYRRLARSYPRTS